jgi:hypothetical protein
MVCVAGDWKAKLQGGTVPVVLTALVHRVVLVSVSVKVTVPVGTVVPVKAGVITAEKLTAWLTTEDEGREELRPRVVTGWLTVRANRLEMFELDAKFVSPL